MLEINFLWALGNAFIVKVIIFQSNTAKCWQTKLHNEEDQLEQTLYFARSLSDHTDAIVLSNLPVEEDDSDGIQITQVIPPNPGLELENEDLELSDNELFRVIRLQM